MACSIDERSGFCAATGIFHSKRPRLLLPADPHLSLPAFLRQQSCARSTGTTAFIDFSSGRSISHAQLHADIKAASAGLAVRLGVRNGDVLLLLAPNSIDFVVLLQAAFSIGAVVTASNPVSLPHEICLQALQCNAKFVATTAELSHKVSELRLPLILLGDASCPSDRIPHHVSLSTLLLEDESSAPSIAVHQDDIALLAFSSGTTGVSKGVMLSHGNLLAQAKFRMSRPATTGLSPIVYLCIIPMFHVYGLSMFCSAIVAQGSPIVLLPKFDMTQMLLAIEKHRITHLPLVPPVLLALSKMSSEEKYNLSSLREVTVGAATVRKDLVTAFKAKFPNVTVLQAYGLTESSAVGTSMYTAEESQEIGSIGLLAPNTEAKIVAIDSGRPLPPNHSGEILLRGPSIMKGYLGRPKEMAISVDKEGFLHTGDFGYINADGFFFIVDRLKELIKYKGYQVAPVELENVLLSHSLIRDAAVVAYPDEEAGQIPAAYVVLADGARLSEADAMKFVAERVAPYKKIRRVEFVDCIPKSPAGKILRRQLIPKPLAKL